MKKKLPILLTLILTLVLCVIGLTACGGVKFKVNFIVDGEVYATIDTSGNEIIAMPEDPIKEGFEFDGWFWDKDTWQQPFTANSLLNAPLSSDMKVYAKWESDISVGESGITFNSLTVNNKTASGVVSNTTTQFDFLNEISTTNGVSYCVAFDEYGIQQIATKVAPLTVGNNTFYIVSSKNGNPLDVYTVTIRRKPTYTVNFNTANGTAVQSQTIEEGEKVTTPTITPSKTGYTFNGWNYDFNTAVTQNITINAVWTANSNTPYKVEYYLENATDNGYTKNESATATLYGTTDTQVSAQVKTFSHFEYKDTAEDSGTISPNGSTVLKVYYTRQKVQVTFNANGGALSSGNNTQMVKYGGTAVAPSFTKTGYSFNGFDKSLENVTTETIISVTWQINQYTLTIVFGNGQSDLVLKQDYGTAIESIANPTKVGYSFTGWSESIPATMPAENKTISASWQINQYTLTIVFGNGQSDLVLKQNYGTAIENIANPTRTGYTFTGWSESVPTTMPAENKTISATWQINQYTLIIVFGNGDADKKITQDYNSQINYQLPAELERAGYTFDGWSGSIPTYMPAKNLTITAKWLAIFNLSGGQITGLTSHGKTFNEIIIPATIDGISITSIGSYAFFNCTSLTSIEIPNGVTSIGYCAFYCTSLTSIEIPNSVTSIDEGAFHGCVSLTSVTFEENSQLTSIYDDAFRVCVNLTSIIIPNSVTLMGNYVFYCCNNLTIYCEAESQPSGWAYDWNSDNRPVEWGYKINNEN